MPEIENRFIIDMLMPRFQSMQLEKEYKEWHRLANSRQLSVIAIVTGFMYVVFSAINGLVAPKEIVAQMIQFICMLFLLSYFWPAPYWFI